MKRDRKRAVAWTVMADDEKTDRDPSGLSTDDPGARRHGNFINYYKFHPAEERARQLPRDVWRRPTRPDRKYLGLDVGCNAGVSLYIFMYA